MRYEQRRPAVASLTRLRFLMESLQQICVWTCFLEDSHVNKNQTKRKEASGGHREAEGGRDGVRRRRAVPGRVDI